MRPICSCFVRLLPDVCDMACLLELHCHELLILIIPRVKFDLLIPCES